MTQATNEAQFEETMRIILDTARDSITSDFRVSECKHHLICFMPPPGRSLMSFHIAHERVHFGVSITALHDHQVSTVTINFQIPKGATLNENTWSSDTNDHSFRLDFKECGIASDITQPVTQVGIMDRELLDKDSLLKDREYGFASEEIQNFQGIISREILSVHFEKIRFLCLRHIEEEVSAIYIANREHILAFGMGSHIRIGGYSRIRNIDSEIIRDIAAMFMKMVLPNASAAAVSASAADG